jgi:putative tryptophan/tyrosine transport system substrate-binding protein
MPAMYPERLFVETGGLMSYGADYRDLYNHAAGQIDQIFKGAKPGEIPFYWATKLELVINLNTARVLGLAIPLTLLARADEVIE